MFIETKMRKSCTISGIILPVRSSALGGTRTPNLLIRSQMLYPLSYKRWFPIFLGCLLDDYRFILLNLTVIQQIVYQILKFIFFQVLDVAKLTICLSYKSRVLTFVLDFG